MKIGLVYEKFVSKGGLENYLFCLTRELLAQGHEVHVLTGKSDKETEGIPVAFHYLKTPSFPKARHLLHFNRAAAKKLDAMPFLDVTIGFGRTTHHDLHRAGGGCHREYSRLLHPLKRLGPKNRIELALEKELYTSGKTRHFIVNSALVAQQLQADYGLPPDKFSIIHTAVDSEKYKPAGPEKRASLRKQIALHTDRAAFLFVSMSHRRKGLDAILRAWRKIAIHDNAELWIVGPRPSKGQLSAIRKFGLEDHIRVFPPAGSVVPYYQAADFFIHPTLYDACANTVLQSMACGLPGIISASDGAIQFIEDGLNGFRLDSPQDPIVLQAAVERALTLTDAQRIVFAEAARKKMLPLTWTAHVARWIEVIKSELAIG
jgi:UDP-glucose:(heptosyl)LPS alpha-1,3-glucosyltransferase